MFKTFKIKYLGEDPLCLHIDRFSGLLGLSQKDYIDCMLKRFNMDDCSPGDASTIKGDKFLKSQYS